jgi:hypothetical protein
MWTKRKDGWTIEVARLCLNNAPETDVWLWSDGFLQGWAKALGWDAEATRTAVATAIERAGARCPFVVNVWREVPAEAQGRTDAGPNTRPGEE